MKGVALCALASMTPFSAMSVAAGPLDAAGGHGHVWLATQEYTQVASWVIGEDDDGIPACPHCSPEVTQDTWPDLTNFPYTVDDPAIQNIKEGQCTKPETECAADNCKFTYYMRVTYTGVTRAEVDVPGQSVVVLTNGQVKDVSFSHDGACNASGVQKTFNVRSCATWNQSTGSCSAWDAWTTFKVTPKCKPCT